MQNEERTVKLHRYKDKNRKESIDVHEGPYFGGLQFARVVAVYVKEETQGYCKMVILRTDLAADQLSYLGSPGRCSSASDISDYVAGLGNTLQSAVGYFGTATMLRNPYCDLRVAVGNPDIPLFASPSALKRCRSLATLKKREFSRS